MADDGTPISGRRFWEKIRCLPHDSGCRVFRLALTLWCVVKADSTPLWAKAIVVAALAYFLVPLDAVPDLLPGGYLDDLAVMALALAEVRSHVTPEIEAEVEELLPAFCRRPKA